MAIICIEGPPAVGKTTTCLELQDTYGAYVIPTEKHEEENGIKQFEDQRKRWQLALRKSREYKVVILDGDIFQPLLAHWLKASPEREAVKDIFQHAIWEKQIGFPDRYYILTAGEKTIRRRKNRDLSQLRWDFEENYQIFSVQHEIYRGLEKKFPGIVREVQAVYEQKTARQVIRQLPAGPWNRYQAEKFQALRERLKEVSLR